MRALADVAMVGTSLGVMQTRLAAPPAGSVPAAHHDALRSRPDRPIGHVPGHARDARRVLVSDVAFCGLPLTDRGIVMSADPQSGLRMLKRTWSDSKTGSSDDAGKSVSAPVVDLTGSPPTPLADVSNVQPPVEEKRRKLDSSWGPFIKSAALAEKKRGDSGAGTRTSSGSSLDALVRPLAGRPGVRAVSGGETRPKVAQPEGVEKRRMSRVFLSTEQQRVLEAVVKQGKNVFFTGSAGTGKSVLLRSNIAELKEKYRNKPDAVAVTASTGIAACNVGGITLHSFGGVGLAKESPERLLSYVRRNRKATTRWMRTAVLIIDESTSRAGLAPLTGSLDDRPEAV